MRANAECMDCASPCHGVNVGRHTLVEPLFSIVNTTTMPNHQNIGDTGS